MKTYIIYYRTTKVYCLSLQAKDVKEALTRFNAMRLPKAEVVCVRHSEFDSNLFNF